MTRKQSRIKGERINLPKDESETELISEANFETLMRLMPHAAKLYPKTAAKFKGKVLEAFGEGEDESKRAPVGGAQMPSSEPRIVADSEARSNFTAAFNAEFLPDLRRRLQGVS